MHTQVLVGALATMASAFPRNVFDSNKLPDPSVYHFNNEKRQAFGINTHFDAKSQFVSTSGDYAWKAPLPTDNRGPCPGLNAAANHGYIPHNGVASIDQFILGTYRAYGMATDLAAFLAVYGAIFDGDLLSWSIGGPTNQLLGGDLLSGLTGNLLGVPHGLEGSHNKYEADYSPTRGDLYQYGDNYHVQMEQFKGLYNLQANVPEDQSNFDLGVQTSWRKTRFQQSVNENPYFFNNFFSGLEVNPAAYTFMFRFMGNKSADFPEGRLSKSILKSFFSITGDTPDEFVYTPGHERIPDNFYKRAIGDEYSIPFFQVDLVGMALDNPEFLSVGGNLGEVNTFTPLDIRNLTGGLWDVQKLAEPGMLQCFLYQVIISQGPDLLVNLFRNIAEPLTKLNNMAAQFLGNLTCPTLSSQQDADYKDALLTYPGYAKFHQNTGTY